MSGLEIKTLTPLETKTFTARPEIKRRPCTYVYESFGTFTENSK